jgi:hypothetical protein
MKLLMVAVLSLFPLVCEAHHSMAGVPVRSAHCGWVQGDSLRDVRNVSESARSRSTPSSGSTP